VSIDTEYCDQLTKEESAVDDLAGVAALAEKPPCNVRPAWNEPLAKHSSVRVGGPADLLLRVRSREALRALAAEAYRRSIPFRVIGDGTNLIAAAAGLRGLVIRSHGGSMRLCEDGVSIWADAGCSLIGTARWAAGLGLSGLEGAATIPGTIGGAVVNNAGAYGWTAADSVRRILVLDDQGERWMKTAEMNYGYRTSTVKQHPGSAVVLGAEMLLVPGDANRILTAITERLQTRQRTQPTSPSSGSVFRNPPGKSAWELIDNAGMRGRARGGAHVSRKHANFIINGGDATSEDVCGLIREIEAAVESQLQVSLIREVEFFGDWGELNR
jgi:UDP-N-acetylmuramate dehydrogenase